MPPGASRPTAAQLAEATKLKSSGNDAFVKGDFGAAFERFTEAMRVVGEAVAKESTSSAARGGEKPDLAAVLFSNRAAACLGLSAHEQALDDAREAVERAPLWGKAHGRVGGAQLALREYADAVEAFEAGLKVSPGSEALERGLREAAAQLG